MNPNKTKTTVPAEGAVVGEEKTVGKNLDFLRYWMRSKGYTQKDLADRFGLNLRTINLWFHNDDVYLKNLYKYLGMVYTRANFEYKIPSQKHNFDVYRYNLLGFLEKALILTDTGKTEFGKRLEEAKVCTRATMFKWFKDDNITISYIYKIAEIMGWEVKVEMEEVLDVSQLIHVAYKEEELNRINHYYEKDHPDKYTEPYDPADDEAPSSQVEEPNYPEDPEPELEDPRQKAWEKAIQAWHSAEKEEDVYRAMLHLMDNFGMLFYNPDGSILLRIELVKRLNKCLAKKKATATEPKKEKAPEEEVKAEETKETTVQKLNEAPSEPNEKS